MDEGEEEALFARLRSSLAALRRDAAAAAGHETGQQPEIMAALARLEASLRTLANGLDSLAQRADALDSGIEARVEQAVARNTAALRLDINRLETRVGAAGPAGLPPGTAPAARVAPAPGGAGRIGLIALALLVVIAGAVAAIRFIPSPQTDSLRQLASERMTVLRGLLTGEKPAPVPAAGSNGSPAPTTAGGAPGEAASQAQSRQAQSAQAQSPQDQSAQAAQSPAGAPSAPSTPAGSNTPPTASPAGTAPGPGTAASSAALQPAASAGNAPQAAPSNKVTIRATAPAWVEVRERSGNVLIRRTLHAGETWETSGKSDLVLSTGNAPALVLDVNGHTQRLPAERVVRDMPLP